MNKPTNGTAPVLTYERERELRGNAGPEHCPKGKGACSRVLPDKRCFTCPANAGVMEVDRSEQGRTSSAVLGNNVQAFVDSGLSFPQALSTALKVYDHPTDPAGVKAPGAGQQG